MKYKLINKQTGEEHLCDKVTIDGFDYYVSDEKPTKQTKPCYCYNSIKNTWDADIVFYQGVMPMYHYEGFKIIIATNNSNIDIPKVVDEVENIVKTYVQELIDCKSVKEHERTWISAICHQSIIKSQETHPFSEEDMVEFAGWAVRRDWKDVSSVFEKSTKELFQLWKEQKLKTLYYE